MRALTHGRALRNVADKNERAEANAVIVASARVRAPMYASSRLVGRARETERGKSSRFLRFRRLRCPFPVQPQRKSHNDGCSNTGARSLPRTRTAPKRNNCAKALVDVLRSKIEEARVSWKETAGVPVPVHRAIRSVERAQREPTRTRTMYFSQLSTRVPHGKENLPPDLLFFLYCNFSVLFTESRGR